MRLELMNVFPFRMWSSWPAWLVATCICAITSAQRVDQEGVLTPRQSRLRDRESKPDEPTCDQLKAMWRFEALKKLIRQEHLRELQRKYETEQKHELKEIAAGRGDVMHSNGSEGACAAHLIRPVLAALDLGVLLQVGEHHDQLQALFPDHAPEVVHGCVGGALRADELLALLCLL
ncbi:unnamed protein product [Leptidea sinapis]|uniref:Secreted protein n=1 Tax=Leptidea sinapis TaxID=189913 RepID=A0A5E4PW18_9NEOP|nr:unnamed protein product [Leptidea sinapis]